MENKPLTGAITQAEVEKLLEEFTEFPQIVKQPTYLEICRYPWMRFEEICSRILCFYFSPIKEHGFGTLFLGSLLKLLEAKNIRFEENQISVISEEAADGKRIDILIHCPNFVIGIENKITANIYNPLPIYQKWINLYHYDSNNSFKVILSLKRIKGGELKNAENNGFKCVTYSELFEGVKAEIGTYLGQANNKYLTYLLDFMQTLENVDGQAFFENKMFKFFSKNSNKIDTLIEDYNLYKVAVLNIQKQKIADLQLKIKERTNDVGWWAWQDYDLGYDNFNPAKPRIGIESIFCEKDGNPLGEFRVKITTWAKKDWLAYHNQITKDYSSINPEYTENNRVKFFIKTIEGNNEQEILDTLHNCYNYLKQLTK